MTYSTLDICISSFRGGTAVVSLEPLADGTKVPDAFDGEKLAFTVDGHSVELSNEGTSLLDKRKSKADVYVRLDRSTVR